MDYPILLVLSFQPFNTPNNIMIANINKNNPTAWSSFLLFIS